MTREQIKALFVAGQEWRITNRRLPADVGFWRVARVGSLDIYWETGAGRITMRLPKARDVLRARDGYLRFRVGTSGEEFEVLQVREKGVSS